MALLFLLVYAGAIAVLVLFVVMMFDVKAIENPWSVNQKRRKTVKTKSRNNVVHHQT